MFENVTELPVISGVKEAEHPCALAFIERPNRKMLQAISWINFFIAVILNVIVFLNFPLQRLS